MPKPLLSAAASRALLLLLLAGCAGTSAERSQPASQPAAAPAGAQDAAPQSRVRDPQSAIEPRSAPGRGQQFLKQMAGDWKVVKTFRSRSGEASTTPGECRQAMIHDGRFLQSDFVFEGPTGRSTGMGIIGFEADSETFTSFWTDSRSTRTSIRQSQGAFSGDEIVLWGRSLGGAETRRSRTSTRMEGPDRIVHRQYSVQADGSERLVMELVMTRKQG